MRFIDPIYRRRRLFWVEEPGFEASSMSTACRYCDSSLATAILFLFLSPLSVNRPSVATSSRIELVSVLISYLPTRFASAVLSAFLESSVKIGSDDTFVEFGASNVFHAVQSLLVSAVFDETEAARGLLEPIQAHHESLDLAALGE